MDTVVWVSPKSTHVKDPCCCICILSSIYVVCDRHAKNISFGERIVYLKLFVKKKQIKKDSSELFEGF